MDALAYPFNSSEILKKKKALKRQLIKQDSLIEKRIAILNGSTIGDIRGVLELFLLKWGIKPHFYLGQYNKFYEDIMFENQELVDFKPDIIYIHTSARNLFDDTILDKLQVVWAKIKEMFSCLIIQNNFELPDYGFEFDCHKVNALNLEIADYANENKDFYINDIQRLSACFGLEKWYDNQDYYLYKYAFSIKAIPLLCHNIAKIIKSIYGKNQKCLVLDLDNTLWGGIVGEIGISGIELGMETAIGEAYVNFQKYVKSLYNKGIILAVCSKNDEHIAKKAFSNPNMILQLDDMTVFCANWDNKAENIIKIANQLNILMESVVFIDDNPAERELVRNTLPEVKVLEVNSVVDFIRHIEGSGYFYAVNISGDDARRNEYYIADAKRVEAKNTFIDYGEYLRSLQMSSEIQSFAPVYLDRITQLVNKTNQFNLTTKRYTLSEIEKIADDSRFITLYATLDDKFGSNGIVSIVIGETVENALHIRLWVMSCRVFKRDLEFAMMDELVRLCHEKGITDIMGYYFKTAKNNIVCDFYGEQGFIKIGEDSSGNTAWKLIIEDDYRQKNKAIEVNRNND